FFSSRRRHTRFSRDWSSDVCSSDLASPRRAAAPRLARLAVPYRRLVGVEATFRDGRSAPPIRVAVPYRRILGVDAAGWAGDFRRSEERRVGKEWRAGGGRDCQEVKE